MSINFPGSNDTFTVPSAPATTPLGSAGDSSPARNNTLSHSDMGAAVMALQAQATFLSHTHDGTTMNGPKLPQANTHQTPDTDSGTTALHHTIGTGANQGAAGNHTHSAATIWPVGVIFITLASGNPSTMGLPGTWTAVTGRFVVAAGSTFTGGSTGGTSTHSHAVTYTTNGAHSHVTTSTDLGDTTNHLNGNNHPLSASGASTFGHTHGNTGSNFSEIGGTNAGYRTGSGSSSMNAVNHSHGTNTSNTSSHSHFCNAYPSSISQHSHLLNNTDTQGSHAHTASMASTSHIPAYLAVNLWQRTA